MQGSAAGPAWAALCPADGVTLSLCAPISHLQWADAARLELRGSQVKNLLLLHLPLPSEVLRRWKMPPWDLAKSKRDLPVRRGKLSRGLLPSTSVLGSISPGNVPFHTSPALLWPPPWLGGHPHAAGAGCQCLIPSPGRDLCPGGIPELGAETPAWCFSLSQGLILDGKAQGGWGS